MIIGCTGNFSLIVGYSYITVSNGPIKSLGRLPLVKRTNLNIS